LDPVVVLEPLRLAIAPDVDRLEQGPGSVLTRHTCGLRVVEVDVVLHELRTDETAGGVEIGRGNAHHRLLSGGRMRSSGRARGRRADRDDAPVPHRDVDESLPAAEACVANLHSGPLPCTESPA